MHGKMTHVTVAGAVSHCAAILVSALICSKRKLFLLAATLVVKSFLLASFIRHERKMSIKVGKESSTIFFWQFFQL